MNAERDRDRQLEQLLKHELGAATAAPSSAACLDAETVAAWMEGGLSPQAIAMAEAHASDCARCQALLGTVARTTPAITATNPHSARLWRWWFAPLAASAAAATLWMVVPREPAPTPASAPMGEAKEMARADTGAARSEPTPTEAPAPAAPAAPPAAITPPPPAAARERANAAVPAPVELGKLAGTRDTLALEESARKAEAPAPAGSAAKGRVAAAAPPADALRKQVDPLADPQLTARSTPSPGVIWLVGRAGMVQLATDGRTFARVPFPEAVDLTAVTATDERHAIVITADGRTFQTADGGRTWQRR